ncbi:hypothetical protein SAY87_018377 [Trapa incisa]|uniref:RBR-type E3 ubiquitin transferase n=1 Tax=Trapa incisa TaxID=236973 RepID=A0AAN7QW53_9MYRT|nr:hypothetical protein SAY87_018377 [Trapa incisa]
MPPLHGFLYQGGQIATPLNPIECMDLAVSDDFLEKWCRLACEESLLGLRRCHCPNPNCREMIIDECHLLEADQRARRIVCPACKKGCCFRCSLRWEEVKERHRCDQVIAMAERKKWMECPGCRNYVDRTEGCKDIICRCGSEFCYNCGKALTSNSLHSCSIEKLRKGFIFTYQRLKRG